MKPMRLQNITTLVLIRHGESMRNKFGKGFCFPDDAARAAIGPLEDRLCPLTGRGKNQAASAGRRLKKLFGVPTKIIHSGFIRARQTAEGILAAYAGTDRGRIEFTENNLVRERNSGYISNMTAAEVERYFPWSGAAWKAADRFTYIPPGGESIVSMCEGRLLLFLQQLDEACRGFQKETVFVVCHGRTIQGLRYLLEGLNHDGMSELMKHANPPNCSMTVYTFDGTHHPVVQCVDQKLW
ncbi:phosphoglycerate mutase family protein [Patescibacteria group bacterium]|nr:phosphoglycerate mutase family protein [Patescibacteria group bacterium]